MVNPECIKRADEQHEALPKMIVHGPTQDRIQVNVPPNYIYVLFNLYICKMCKVW